MHSKNKYTGEILLGGGLILAAYNYFLQPGEQCDNFDIVQQCAIPEFYYYASILVVVGALVLYNRKSNTEDGIAPIGAEDPFDSDDELYDDVKAAVIDAGKASTSYLQRKFRIGYSRAAALIDRLEDEGIVGPAEGGNPRTVIKSDAEF
ncbi:DNA translocase FtsK [Microbaculum sp. FT89]|uniref:DNA translocase FtsK n=1 Tax=Microbaculum sp. FT89 TaxID=3447298 RepID=UPI003F53305F